MVILRPSLITKETIPFSIFPAFHDVAMDIPSQSCHSKPNSTFGILIYGSYPRRDRISTIKLLVSGETRRGCRTVETPFQALRASNSHPGKLLPSHVSDNLVDTSDPAGQVVWWMSSLPPLCPPDSSIAFIMSRDWASEMMRRVSISRYMAQLARHRASRELDDNGRHRLTVSIPAGYGEPSWRAK